MIKKYIWQIIILILIIIIFLQNSCNNKKDDIIIIPPKTGTFNYVKPDTVYKTSFKYITSKGDTIIFKNPLNTKLKNNYDSIAKLNDSLQLKLLYYTAIQSRSYKKIFDNKDITATVFAETTGTLDSLKLDYTIKSDTIKIKQPIFRLLAGPSVEFNPVTLNNNLKLNIGIQNQKGNIITGSIDSNKNISAGYIFNIWTIKK